MVGRCGGGGDVCGGGHEVMFDVVWYWTKLLKFKWSSQWRQSIEFFLYIYLNNVVFIYSSLNFKYRNGLKISLCI